MFDPAALGTMLIGLDHARRENEWTDPPSAARTRRPHRGRSLTRPVVASLRWLADVIEARWPRRDLGLEG